jgi:hypothetical protein
VKVKQGGGTGDFRAVSGRVCTEIRKYLLMIVLAFCILATKAAGTLKTNTRVDKFNSRGRKGEKNG